MKKFAVLFSLLVIPICAYLFFAAGEHNFGTLAVLRERPVSFEHFVKNDKSEFLERGQISIVSFFGNNPEKHAKNIFNFSQKIYKPFDGFANLRMISIVPLGSGGEMQEMLEKISKTMDTGSWIILEAEPQRIREFYASLANGNLPNADLSSKYVFILDKKNRIRGRDDEPDNLVPQAYDISSIAALNNRMVDDVRIILAEYRKALKSNMAERDK